MVPIFFTVGNNLPVMVIPDTEAHIDGHPVITYRYNIYYDEGLNDNNDQTKKETALLLQSKTDPSYMGQILFEQPGKLFTYIADGNRDLEGPEVEEIIEHINQYRARPDAWQY